MNSRGLIPIYLDCMPLLLPSLCHLWIVALDFPGISRTFRPPKPLKEHKEDVR